MPFMKWIVEVASEKFNFVTNRGWLSLMNSIVAVTVGEKIWIVERMFIFLKELGSIYIYIFFVC